ncbi:uncharacterized protein LOC126971991 [Leptidea sinapis]|uniref:uncharacterized protein LOC126971991 n=1 Tax=Leptidea sinapis TaxID=189913 RepID=UPI0021C46AB2|nr:uncharacterized protein LOC126971991 [Leptidea sinapis]
MASGTRIPIINGTNGVDLSNYIRDPNSYNPVVYIHKKYYPGYNHKDSNAIQKVKHTLDKSIQANLKNKSRQIITEIINDNHHDPVLEQTIKFAKDIIPLTIPPSEDDSQNSIKYTIKTCKKCRHLKRSKPPPHEKDVTIEKEKSKKVCKSFVNLKFKNKDSFSGKDSSNFSSQNNTLDDINENHSICCSLSEISEKKHLKRDRRSKSKQSNMPNSVEALATENINTTNEVKLKE